MFIRPEINCLGGLQITKAQASLRIRSDLEIIQLHQTRPSAAVRSVGHDHFLVRKKNIFWPKMLIWSGHFFQFPLDFKFFL